MSPQRKGIPKPADVERIQKARELQHYVELEVVEAVLSAMRHGGSIREVAIASGLSESTIIRWRKGQGLPTHEDWHAPARERREALYAAYPWLKETSEMLRQMKSDGQAEE